jgi:hypothetical protein
MLYVFLGTDRQKAHAAMHAALEKREKGRRIVRVTDANAVEDLRAALAGPGLFNEARAIVLDGVLANEEMRAVVMDSLAALKAADDSFYMFEEKLDAATKRAIEKHAERVEKFDAVKEAEDRSIFALKFALQGGDKKKLWLGVQKELIAGKAPEMVHGFLFWAAKDMVLKKSDERGKRLVAELAELPHEARRHGEELEYALERFVLSRV